MKKSITLAFFLLCCVFLQAQQHLVPVYTATSQQSPQPGNEVFLAIDDADSTMYHSNWYQTGIPDQLDFYFVDGVQSINEIVYTPRQSQLNGVWTNIDLLYATQDDPTTFIPVSDSISWAADHTDKTISLSTPLENVAVIRFVVNAGYNDFSSCAEMRFYSDQPYENPFQSCAVATDSLPTDTKVAVIADGSYASSFQAGEDISGSFDGDLSTLYHSSYGNTQMPVTLNYHFDGNTPVDYLKYTPRTDYNINGAFGNVIVKYNTSTNSSFVTLTSFDFEQEKQPKFIEFPNTITPLNIQIIVQDGANGFASCAEMEFFSYNTNAVATAPEGIFTDALYTELLPGVTQTQIDAIASSFYKNLAQCIYNGTYSNYRYNNYEVYKPRGILSQELKTSGYDPYENPTGIYFESGEKVVLFAQNIDASTPVYLTVKNYEQGYGGPSGLYPLKNGLNVFEVNVTGLGYIHYYNTNLNAPDVSVNIVSGQVNGVFDLDTSTNADWVQLLTNSTYPRLDIIGEKAHLVYNRDALKAGSPFDGISLIEKYDQIVRIEHNLMGLYYHDIVPKNHMLAFSEYGGGYYAGGLGVHLDITWGVNNIANPEQLDLWGIPHEFGHVNQVRPGLRWVGTTEVTNNIYSAWVQLQMNPEGNNYTRLERESQVPIAGMPSVAGGRINGAINLTYVQGKALQDTTASDVFKILVPFWQLELYYQKAGASRNAPTLSLEEDSTNYQGVDYAHWFGIVAQKVRNTNAQGLTNGDLVMNFVKNTCDAVQEDLTDFFTRTGFLKPIDVTIDDYGYGQLTITQAMVDSTKAYIARQNYSAPVSPVINYISTHSINAYKNQLNLTGVAGQGVSVDGYQIMISHQDWPNAVAFEVYNAQDSLMHVAINGTGDVNLTTSTVYYPEDALGVYAIGFDGEKRLVYPADLSVDKPQTATLKVYPNPFSNTDNLQIELPNFEGNLNIALYDLTGRVLTQLKGSLQKVEAQLNQYTPNLTSGIYFLKLSTAKGRVFETKLIKN